MNPRTCPTCAAAVGLHWRLELHNFTWVIALFHAADITHGCHNGSSFVGVHLCFMNKSTVNLLLGRCGNKKMFTVSLGLMAKGCQPPHPSFYELWSVQLNPTKTHKGSSLISLLQFIIILCNSLEQPTRGSNTCLILIQVKGLLPVPIQGVVPITGSVLLIWGPVNVAEERLDREGRRGDLIRVRRTVP